LKASFGNLVGGQIHRLHRFQRLDIFTEAGIGDAGGIGGDKFLADIAKPSQEILLTADERGLTLTIFPRKLSAQCLIFHGTKSVTGQFAFRAIPIG
jgi:hypothetical protein